MKQKSQSRIWPCRMFLALTNLAVIRPESGQSRSRPDSGLGLSHFQCESLYSGEIPRGEKMLYSGADPESYITEYTLAYEANPVTARFGPWFEPFSVRKSLQPFKLFPPRPRHASGGKTQGIPTPGTPYTLDPTPYALNPTPYTLHPTPYTLHHNLNH